MPPDRRRSVIMTLRVTKGEYELLRSEAERRGMSVSELLMRPWRKESKE